MKSGPLRAQGLTVDSAADSIEDPQTNGRIVFTAEAVRALGKSVPAVPAQLRRLKE